METTTTEVKDIERAFRLKIIRFQCKKCDGKGVIKESLICPCCEGWGFGG